MKIFFIKLRDFDGDQYFSQESLIIKLEVFVVVELFFFELENERNIPLIYIRSNLSCINDKILRLQSGKLVNDLI